MRKKIGFIILIGLILVNCVFLTGCIGNEKKEQSADIEEGKSVLKKFTATTLNGEDFTQDNLSGKDITIINFWSTTCGPCIAEMPDLAEYQKNLPENIQLITVCLDGEYNNNIENAKSIMEISDFDGTTLINGEGDYQTLCSQIQYTPTTIFVDSKGIQLGKPMIGKQDNLAKSYTSTINTFLRDMGKAEISYAEE